MGASPSSVPGETSLTQALYGSLDNGSYLTRGYDLTVQNMNMPNTNNNTQVEVGSVGGYIPADELNKDAQLQKGSASMSTATAGK